MENLGVQLQFSQQDEATELANEAMNVRLEKLEEVKFSRDCLLSRVHVVRRLRIVYQRAPCHRSLKSCSARSGWRYRFPVRRLFKNGKERYIFWQCHEFCAH